MQPMSDVEECSQCLNDNQTVCQPSTLNQIILNGNLQRFFFSFVMCIYGRIEILDKDNQIKYLNILGGQDNDIFLFHLYFRTLGHRRLYDAAEITNGTPKTD